MRKFRYELKFIITKEQAKVLQKKLSLLMNIDKNAKNEDNTYFIRSVYFDDFDSTAYYEKIDGVEFRKKYRIRFYNYDSKFIKLECKYKYQNLTSKDNENISKELCEALIKGNIENIDINELKDGLLKRFILDMKLSKLRPVVVVDYERIAYTLNLSDLRITFDTDVRSCGFNREIFNKSLPAYKMLDKNKQVLEVKFNEFIPEHIANILSSVPTFRQAVSKFAICRSIL